MKQSTLSTSQAAALKWRLKCGDSFEQIAADFGITVMKVRRIANGYHLRYVKAIEPKV